MPTSTLLTLASAVGVLLAGPALGVPVSLGVPAVVLVVCLYHGVRLIFVGRTASPALVISGTALVVVGACAALIPAAPGVAGLAVVGGGLAVAGLLGAPRVSAEPRAVIRQGLDGLCVALWKFVVLWIVVLEPGGGLSPAAFVTCLLACLGITVAVVAGVRAPYPRAAALMAAVGVAALVLGLAILALLPVGTARPGWLLGAGIILVIGSTLAWTGGSRLGARAGGPAPVVVDGTLVGDPLLVGPVLAGLAAVGYGFLSQGRLSAATIAIGVVAVVVLTCREIFESRQVRRFAGQLAAQEAHFRSLVAGSSDVIMVLERDLTVRWQSPAAARQLGLSDQEVVGAPFAAMVHPDDRERVATGLSHLDPGAAHLVGTRVRDGFGAWRDAEFTVSDLRDTPAVGGLVIHLRDVSERAELEYRLHRTVRTDPLTGLVNRATLLAGIPAEPTVDGTAGTLLAIGLDGFAGINDVHGPDVGDAMLVEVARRIRSTVDGDDLAARTSGDEFAVYTRTGQVRAYTLASRLQGELSEPYRLPGLVLHLTAGIGLARAAGPDTLRQAGLALRRAKQGGRGRVEWHDDEAEAAYVRRARLEQHLPDAIGRGELDLAYHPIHDLVEGCPVGIEALLRWRHPEFGTIPPVEALATARQVGLSGEVHGWVLNRACRQLTRWRLEGYRLWLAVNVAGDDLRGPDFAESLSLALDSHQVNPHNLVLELAERELDENLDRTVAPLATVRALGVRTALDGFGTGATSLAHLRRLPLDLLKIDRGLFTEPPGRGGAVAPILDTVVELGRKLDLTVIAHGLEADSDRDTVRRAGCRYGQGFLFGQPGPAERVEAELVHQPTL